MFSRFFCRCTVTSKIGRQSCRSSAVFAADTLGMRIRSALPTRCFGVGKRGTRDHGCTDARFRLMRKLRAESLRTIPPKKFSDQGSDRDATRKVYEDRIQRSAVPGIQEIWTSIRDHLREASMANLILRPKGNYGAPGAAGFRMLTSGASRAEERTVFLDPRRAPSPFRPKRLCRRVPALQLAAGALFGDGGTKVPADLPTSTRDRRRRVVLAAGHGRGPPPRSR